MPWGFDIENEEFGLLVNERGAVGIARDSRVRHNFPGFRQLSYIFSNRVYWWALFSRYSRWRELVLMTRGFGYTTAAPTAALLAALAGAVSPFSGMTGVCNVLAIFLLGLFAGGYARFWVLCRRRRGALFALGAVMASLFFSFLIMTSAARAYVESAWRSLVGKPISFSQDAMVTAS